MTPRASASLDDWLAQAEAVLEDQRERSISPSSVPVWSDEPLVKDISYSELSNDLHGLLKVICERPGRWILIVDDASGRCWQAQAYEDGSVTAEVASNHYLPVELHWSAEQETEFVELGWEVPVPPHRLNWWRDEPNTSPPVAEVAQRALSTLSRVFGATVHDRLSTTLFASPDRGDTSASPEYIDSAREDFDSLSPTSVDLEEDPPGEEIDEVAAAIVRWMRAERRAQGERAEGF